ncbi:MAG TPA: glycoside hydrolase family 5 protein [Caldilineae bacterium]|nr:glycoside hydrolase family 5 protein [Caldilineae bacterium]
MALITIIAAGCAFPLTPGPGAQPSPVATRTPSAEEIWLGRGVNLGNALEAPYEGAWGVVLQEDYFQLISDVGFNSVRIPIRWSAHAGQQPPYTIDERFFARVDWAINQALSRGLKVIINIHHYDELMRDPEGHRERFLALWRQVAEHYADYPPELIFELLNEPHGWMTASAWNALLAEGLKVVRESNPTRWVIIGPVRWNHISALPSLKLPKDDPYLIVTVHYYEPFRFTHQGAEWVPGSKAWLGTRWEGTEAEKRAIEDDFDRAVAWARRHDRVLFLGEFGAYSKADMESRVRWTRFVARQAEARGISWAYWEFCAGFGIYDRARGRWNQALLEALVPPQ